jgi:hypothetical protein
MKRFHHNTRKGSIGAAKISETTVPAASKNKKPGREVYPCRPGVVFD